MSRAHRKGTQSRSLRRYSGKLDAPEYDLLVVEEPLEIRYAHSPVGTLMRTPGHDSDLALGYLYGEGWINEPCELGALSVCASGIADRQENGEESSPGENVVNFIPAVGVEPPRNATPRSGATTSSCGICGKQTIEDAMFLRPPVSAASADSVASTVAPEVLGRLPDLLRGEQELFSSTGALHAAGLFDLRGRLLALREDIGRHNAVDKIVGDAFRRGALPLGGHILQVSGRVSFEIVQKAYRAGIPIISAVSGVSSLGVEFAEKVGITLVGFVRGGKFSVYSHAERLSAGR